MKGTLRKDSKDQRNRLKVSFPSHKKNKWGMKTSGDLEQILPPYLPELEYLDTRY